MVHTVSRPLLAYAEYVAGEELSSRKHDYVQGAVFAMAAHLSMPRWRPRAWLN